MNEPETVSPASETDAEKIARLERERDEAEQKPEAGADAPEPAPATPPLQALAQAVHDNPAGSFIDHLKKLAADGVTATINPQDEHDVLRVVAALVSDIVKVKL
jgi:hypothetical protein